MRFAVLLGIAYLTCVPAALAQNGDCEEARCAVQAEINKCGCDGASNHGRYVSCVAHAVNDLAKDGTIPNNCRGKIKRCAARSTCGKPGFVTCTIPISTCDNIDPTTLMGTCANDPAIACDDNLDCGSRCATKRGEDGEARCLERGGVIGSGSCCAACVTTPTTSTTLP